MAGLPSNIGMGGSFPKPSPAPVSKSPAPVSKPTNIPGAPAPAPTSKMVLTPTQAYEQGLVKTQKEAELLMQGGIYFENASYVPAKDETINVITLPTSKPSPAAAPNIQSSPYIYSGTVTEPEQLQAIRAQAAAQGADVEVTKVVTPQQAQREQLISAINQQSMSPGEQLKGAVRLQQVAKTGEISYNIFSNKPLENISMTIPTREQAIQARIQASAQISAEDTYLKASPLEKAWYGIVTTFSGKGAEFGNALMEKLTGKVVSPGTLTMKKEGMFNRAVFTPVSRSEIEPFKSPGQVITERLAREISHPPQTFQETYPRMLGEVVQSPPFEVASAFVGGAWFGGAAAKLATTSLAKSTAAKSISKVGMATILGYSGVEIAAEQQMLRLEGRVQEASGKLFTHMVSFGVGIEGAISAQKSLSPITFSELKIPAAKGEEVVWRGIGTQWGGKGKPLIGIQEGKIVFGTPKFEVTRISEPFITENPIPTKILMENLPSKPRETFRIGTEVMKATENVKSNILQEFSRNVKAFKTEKGVETVLEVTREYGMKARIYGSEASTTQMNARPAGDIDLMIDVSSEKGEMIAKDLIGRLKNVGENVMISKKSPTLIESKIEGNLRHAVDIHTNEMTQAELSSSALAKNRAYGFNVNQKTIKVEGIPTQRLSEQGIRKGASIFTVRPTEKGIELAPEPHRAKDIGDFFAIQEHLLNSKVDANAMSKLKLLKTHYPEVKPSESITFELYNKPIRPSISSVAIRSASVSAGISPSLSRMLTSELKVSTSKISTSSKSALAYINQISSPSKPKPKSKPSVSIPKISPSISPSKSISELPSPTPSVSSIRSSISSAISSKSSSYLSSYSPSSYSPSPYKQKTPPAFPPYLPFPYLREPGLGGKNKKFRTLWKRNPVPEIDELLRR